MRKQGEARGGSLSNIVHHDFAMISSSANLLHGKPTFYTRTCICRDLCTPLAVHAAREINKGMIESSRKEIIARNFSSLRVDSSFQNRSIDAFDKIPMRWDSLFANRSEVSLTKDAWKDRFISLRYIV